jgi:CRP-like cAMP-binding protein
VSSFPAVLTACPLFSQIEPHQLQQLLNCLGAVRRRYPKGGVVLSMGEPVSDVGIVIEGGVHVVQEDFWGNRTLVSGVGPGGLFAEAFSCTGTPHLPVSVIAAEPLEVLFIDYRRIQHQCPAGCGFHGQLIRNMLSVLAHKNQTLTRKLWHVTRRTTRQKLLSYLSAVATEQNSDQITIPFNRQDLADYLAVDRSAMSSELARMQNEGILRYHRNHFTLLRQED